MRLWAHIGHTRTILTVIYRLILAFFRTTTKIKLVSAYEFTQQTKLISTGKHYHTVIILYRVTLNVYYNNVIYILTVIII